MLLDFVVVLDEGGDDEAKSLLVVVMVGGEVGACAAAWDADVTCVYALLATLLVVVPLLEPEALLALLVLAFTALKSADALENESSLRGGNRSLTLSRFFASSNVIFFLSTSTSGSSTIAAGG